MNLLKYTRLSESLYTLPEYFNVSGERNESNGNQGTGQVLLKKGNN